MMTNLEFRSFTPADKVDCLSIFDENCPEFFALNERADYAQFLGSLTAEYEVCILDGIIIGAYGLAGKNRKWGLLNWILISPGIQNKGIGSKFLSRVKTLSIASNNVGIEIAASHLSAPFFEKQGALPIREVKNGWGPGMHRVDMELKW